MLKVTRRLLPALALCLLAVSPSVADLDAHSRATGNRLDVATSVGEKIFAAKWPAQVLQIEANQMGPNLVLGLHLSGVKFHDPISRTDFESEVRTLVARAFAAAPAAEEVDVWTTVPIAVGKGVIVSGDLAKPTTRTVYTLTAQRGANEHANIFMDEEWALDAFKKVH